MNAKNPHTAFTVVELVASIAVVAIVAFVTLSYVSRRPPRAYRIRCVNNLKNIGLAARIYAVDNGDRYPGAVLLSNLVSPAKIDIVHLYLTLSNELSTPTLLVCPEDRERQLTDSFAHLQRTNISYFMSLIPNETNAQAFLAGDRNLQMNNRPIPPGLFTLTSNTPVTFSARLHNDQGNVTLADGSVQQFSSSRLKQGIADQQISRNYLTIP